MCTGGTGNQTANLVIHGRPVLPPEPKLPLKIQLYLFIFQKLTQYNVNNYNLDLSHKTALEQYCEYDQTKTNTVKQVYVVLPHYLKWCGTETALWSRLLFPLRLDETDVQLEKTAHHDSSKFIFYIEEGRRWKMCIIKIIFRTIKFRYNHDRI